MRLSTVASWCMQMVSVQWSDQDAMDGLDEVWKQRYELKITGRLNINNDGSESEDLFFSPQSSAAHRSRVVRDTQKSS